MVNHILVSNKFLDMFLDENIEVYPIQILNDQKCSYYMAHIIELRKYEFCTRLKNKVNTVLGSFNI